MINWSFLSTPKSFRDQHYQKLHFFECFSLSDFLSTWGVTIFLKYTCPNYRGHYNDTHWFANATASLSGTKTDTNKGELRSEFRFGIQDALFALGLKTDCTCDFTAYGEWFFGISSNRLKNDNVEKKFNDNAVFNVGNPSTGVQAACDWTVDSFENCKLALSALARFTHFFEKDLTIEEKNISYRPGSYVDLLLGFTQYYGSCHQHRVELGYNPTIRVIKAVAEIEQPTDDMVIKANEPESNNVHHTAYAVYSYDCTPFIFSVGGSATIVPHSNTYGTVFGTFGWAF